MSRSQLNRKVRAITGYNTSAYILQMRMERSKRLSASTEELIGDIALKCGFEDANYFARLFKQDLQRNVLSNNAGKASFNDSV